MRRKTHNAFARMLVGRAVRVKDIDKINSAIDNPTKFDKSMKELYGVEDLDFLNLTDNAKHREVNHDPIFGLQKALAIDPIHGFDIFLSHLMMDKMSNMIRDSFGTDNRDMAEIFINQYMREINKKLPPVHKPFRAENSFEKWRKKNKFYRMKNKKR